MNLYESQPEKLFDQPRLVFKNAERSPGSGSQSDKPVDKKDTSAGGEKVDKANTPDKKEEKKADLPQKISSTDIRNVVRTKAKKLLDRTDLDPALRKEVETAVNNVNLDLEQGEKRDIKTSNEAAGQLIAILKSSDSEDKSLSYWSGEAEKDSGIGAGLTKKREEIELKKSLQKAYDDLNAKLPAEQKKHKDAQEAYNDAKIDYNTALDNFDKVDNELESMKDQDFPSGYKSSVSPDYNSDQELAWLQAQMNVYNGGNGYSKEEADAFTSQINILTTWKTKKANLEASKTALEKTLNEKKTALEEAQKAKIEAEKNYQKYKEDLLKAAKAAGVEHPADNPADVYGEVAQSIDPNLTPATPATVESKDAAKNEFEKNNPSSNPWTESVRNQAAAIEGQLNTAGMTDDVKADFLGDVTRIYKEGDQAIKAYDRLMKAYDEYKKKFNYSSPDQTANAIYQDGAWRFDRGAMGDAAKKFNESAAIYEAINSGMANVSVSNAVIDGVVKAGTQEQAQVLKNQAEAQRKFASNNGLKIDSLLSVHFQNANSAMENGHWARAIDQYKQAESMVQAANSAESIYQAIPVRGRNLPEGNAIRALITQGTKYYYDGSFAEAQKYYSNALKAYNKLRGPKFENQPQVKIETPNVPYSTEANDNNSPQVLDFMQDPNQSHYIAPNLSSVDSGPAIFEDPNQTHSTSPTDDSDDSLEDFNDDGGKPQAAAPNKPEKKG